MKRQIQMWGAVALLAAMPLPVLAQEAGRTDGPEGSEYGKGGYRDPSGGGHFSLEFNWGAAVNETSLADDGPPLFVGLTASLWGDDWYQLDFSTAYVMDDGRLDLLVGPRFRTYGYPLSLSVGLKAGAIVIPNAGLHFGLSPQVGADLMLDNHNNIILGLAYAPDIPLPVEVRGDEIVGNGITHRLFMSLGYRF
jgi:hypothetical protein